MNASVVLVTYNSAAELPGCLEGLRVQRTDIPDLELIVIDNASTDGSAALAEPDASRVIRCERNIGFAAAVNLGVDATSSDHVVLLNPDCRMGPGCLKALLCRLNRAGVAGTAAMLFDPDGSPRRFALREVTLGVVLLTLTRTGQGLDRRLGSPGEAKRWYDAELLLKSPTTPVDCPAAACVAFRRRSLLPRAMDPQFPLYFNDADLCRRLRRRGGRLEVVREATAVHDHAASTSRVPLDRNRAEFVASLIRYVAVEWGPGKRLALLGGLLADAGMSLIRARLGRKDRMLLRHARGTLGGFGMPGGAQPWLSTPAGLRGLILGRAAVRR